MKQYYCYIYFCPLTDEPKYVGHGSENRYADHLKATHAVNQLFGDWLLEIKSKGKTPRIELLNVGSKKEAEQLEFDKIIEFGRLNLGNGPLFNLTDDGRGTKGYKVTESHSKAISKSNSTREQSEKAKKNFQQWNLGKHHSEELKQKISDSLKGHKKSSVDGYKVAATNRRWVSKDGKLKSTSADLLQSFLDDGWVQGKSQYLK
jgi:hypothetical protein